jgi:hypothetical protein
MIDLSNGSRARRAKIIIIILDFARLFASSQSRRQGSRMTTAAVATYHLPQKQVKREKKDRDDDEKKERKQAKTNQPTHLPGRPPAACR